MARLNHVYLKNRLAELGLKQGWVADQLGVDRKTVIRWVHGQSLGVKPENIGKLALLLGCDTRDLDTHTEHFASTEDQKIAAKHLAESRLIDQLAPIGEWALAESLLKATMVKNLPKDVLGELYDQLTVAAWRQSKFAEAERFNSRTTELAKQSGDQGLLTRAWMSQANLQFWRGEVGEAEATYRKAIEHSRFLDKKRVASVHSNLGAILLETGRFEEAEKQLQTALGIFSESGTPMNQAIARQHLAIVLLRTGRVPDARREAEESLRCSDAGKYLRGQAMGRMILAEVSARENQEKEARAFLADALGRFETLKIDEPLNHEFAGRVLRLLGDFEGACQHFEEGLELARDLPVAKKAILEEISRMPPHVPIRGA